MVVRTSASYCMPGENGKAVCSIGDTITEREGIIIIMFFTWFLFGLGEILDRNELYNHLVDTWNGVDVMSNCLVFIWVVLRHYPGFHSLARGALGLSAIPMSVGLLRFLSVSQEYGQLVVTLIAMVTDLVSFLGIFIISVLGYGGISFGCVCWWG